MNALHQKLLVAFEAEHRDHVDAVRAMLDAYEDDGGAGGAINLVELHRRLHSLKGAARAVDMKPVESLAHALETLVEDCQADAIDVGPAAGAMRRGLDAIEDWVASSLAGEAAADLEDAIALVRKAGQATPPAPADKPASPGPRLVAATEEAATTDVSSERATREEKRSGAEPRTLGASASVDSAKGEAAQAVLTRVETRSFDAFVQSSSEILAAMGGQDDALGALELVKGELKAIALAVRAHDAEERRPQSDWITPANDTLEQIVERVRNADAMLSDFERRQRDQAWRMRRLGRGLQEQVAHLQTVSADFAFGAARKIVRDIAQEQGKQVRVSVRGLDTLADRTVLQRLKDPVVHLLRNAIHHGIETPEERVAAGKPEEGCIILEVGARGPNLVVSIEDDGRGVDREKALQRAREQGLTDAAALAEAQGGDITHLLTHAGLSTASSITEIAGRGIGLSVVKEAVTALGGTFTISEREPCGARSLIEAPASLLAARFLLVKAGDDLACLPVNRIGRIHHITEENIELIDERAHALMGDEPPMPLASLAFLVGRGDNALPAAKSHCVLELRTKGQRLGVVVDETTGVRDGVMRDLELDPAHAGCVAGVLVTDAGDVVPVLDTAELTSVYNGSDARCVVRSNKDDKTKQRTSILIADDSITTRTLEKSVLEANGYHVRVSVDGADALRQLRLQKADLVVSDVEMPNLDGFGLVGAIKRDPDLKQIPVILVTSRSEETDRRRGLNLGADAYLIKQRFDQTELLNIIGRLL